MTPSTHDRETPNIRPSLRLKVQKFDLITRILGCESDSARAELLDVAYITVRRARTGAQVGEVFVAQTIAAFNRHVDTLSRYGLEISLDELFEVVEPDHEEVAA